MSFFDLNDEEQRSFLSVVRHTVLDGELRLVRFTDSLRGHESAWGRLDDKTGLHRSYWMYASEVAEILSDIKSSRPYGFETIKEVSKRWAHCDDWGNLARAWIMTIPRGRTLNAYVGFAKFQPRISPVAQRETGRLTSNFYPGGSLQLATRIGPQERQWIKGPQRTLDLSAKKLQS